MKEYLKHFTEKVNVMVSRDLRSLINHCLGITDTFLIFGRQPEVSAAASSKAGQSENTSGNLQTYSKISHAVQRLLPMLDLLASAEARPLLSTSETFSSPQDPFTWLETYTLAPSGEGPNALYQHHCFTPSSFYTSLQAARAHYFHFRSIHAAGFRDFFQK